VWFGEAGRRAVPGLVAVGDADEINSVEIRVARVAANLALAHVDLGGYAGVVRERLVGLSGDADFAVGVSAAVALAFQEPVLGVLGISKSQLQNWKLGVAKIPESAFSKLRAAPSLTLTKKKPRQVTAKTNGHHPQSALPV